MSGQRPPSPGLAVQQALHFCAVLRDSNPAFVTPPQAVFIDPEGPAQDWQVTDAPAWLRVTPRAGRSPARLSIALKSELIGPTDSATGDVTVSLGGTRLSYVIHVTLAVLHDGGAPPFGAIDIPRRGAFVDESAQISGWALDDIAIRDLLVCTDARPELRQQPLCGTTVGKTLLGRAKFAYGGRPDVQNVYAATPLNARSSWSFTIDRALLPQGPFRIYVVARDVDGHEVTIASRSFIGKTTARKRLGASPVTALLCLLALFWVGQAALLGRTPPYKAPVGSRSGPVQMIEYVCVGLATCLALGFGIRHIDRGFNYDELYSASQFIVGMPLRVAATKVEIFNNHFGFSVLARLATMIFGSSREWAVRLPALLLGVATVAAAWRLLRDLFGRAVAVLGIFLLALNPFFVSWIHSARGYSGLTVMTVISSRNFLLLLRDDSRPAATRHAIASVLAVYFHLYGLWIIGVQYLIFLWCIARRALDGRRGRADGRRLEASRSLWWSFGIVGTGVVVLYLPAVTDLWSAVVGRGRGPFNSSFPLELLRTFAGSDSQLRVGLCLALIATAPLLFRDRRLEYTYLFGVLVLPLSCMWLWVRPLDLYPRFFAYWTPFFCGLVAAGAVGLGGTMWRAMTKWVPMTWTDVRQAACAGLICLPVWWGWARTDLTSGSDDGYRRELSSALVAGPSRAYAIGGNAEMFDYYLGRPLTVLRSASDLDTDMREDTSIMVAYHKTPWNSSEDIRMLGLLKRRCLSDERGLVTIFQCGN